MALYEHVLIARQDLSSSAMEELVAKYAKVITDGGGRVTKVEPWGLRALAYRINNNRKGHYVLMNLDTPAAALIEMERRQRIDEDILRYLSIKVDQLEDAPSAMMRTRESRREEEFETFASDESEVANA